MTKLPETIAETTGGHQAKEFHEDETIGILLQRIKRRSEEIYYSQDGVEIHALERAQIRDREKLEELSKAYEKEGN